MQLKRLLTSLATVSLFFQLQSAPINILEKPELNNKPRLEQVIKNNSEDLDLEGILDKEPDDFRALELNLSIYTADFDKQANLHAVSSELIKFYKEYFNVELKIKFVENKYTLVEHNKTRDKFKAVFLNSQSIDRLIESSKLIYHAEDGYVGELGGDFAHPKTRTATIDVSHANEIRKWRFYAQDNLTDYYIHLVRHEMGHLFGLLHPYPFFQFPENYYEKHIAPGTIVIRKPEGKKEFYNFMLVRDYMPNGVNLRGGIFAAPMQIKQVRSYLRGGAAYREFKKDDFDFDRFSDRVQLSLKKKYGSTSE